MGEPFRKFEEIEAWQSARKLANLVYDLSEKEAFRRDYALRDQIRRAAISVLSNIAEGYGSRTRKLFIEFLGRAKGSNEEVRAQLYLALDREYLDHQDFRSLYRLNNTIGVQIFRLIRYLESQPD